MVQSRDFTQRQHVRHWKPPKDEVELLSNDDDTELYEIDKDIVGNCKLTIKRADKGAEGKYACRIVGREKEKNCFTKSEFVLKGTHVCNVGGVACIHQLPLACRIYYPCGMSHTWWHAAYLGMSRTLACRIPWHATHLLLLLMLYNFYYFLIILLRFSYFFSSDSFYRIFLFLFCIPSIGSIIILLLCELVFKQNYFTSFYLFFSFILHPFIISYFLPQCFLQLIRCNLLNKTCFMADNKIDVNTSANFETWCIAFMRGWHPTCLQIKKLKKVH